MNGMIMSGNSRGMINVQRQLDKGSGVDWLGAVIRRKGVVVFTVVVSAILGYLAYLKQPKVYASQLKLMVWTQQPPRSIDSENIVQTSATGKYLQLLLSHSVMEDAAKLGDLAELQTFTGKDAPQYALKQMVSVTPVEGAVDTLTVMARGSHPQDLPVILTSVVSAFEKNLLADSARFSEEVAEVFKSFQDKLAEDKSATEASFRELIKKLAISPDPVTRQYINPYLAEIQDLKSMKNDYVRELRDVKERVVNMEEIAKLPPEERAESLRVLATEASKFLQIAVTEVADNADRSTRMSRCQNRIDILEGRVRELRLEESKNRRTVGNKHPAQPWRSSIKSSSTRLN